MERDTYYLFTSNEATSSRSLTVNLENWGIAPGARAIVEQVSADRQGEVSQILTVPANGILNLTQPAQSVFRVSVPKTAPTYVVSLGATDDAMVKAGANANNNFGASPNLYAKNSVTNPAARNVSYIKFNTGDIANSEVQQAILQVWGQNTGSASQVITHVYGLTDNNWDEATITWNTAPNLSASNSTSLNDISQNFITDIGNTAHIVGELTAVATARQMSIDVTDFVRNHPDEQITFLIAREVRFDGENVDDSLTSLQLASRQRGTDPGPQLFMTLSSFALPGDFDHDGIVDANDYTIWRQDYGMTNSDADGNRDGVVDAGDYVIWRHNQGKTLPSSSSVAAATLAVPEATAAWLAGLAVGLLLLKRGHTPCLLQFAQTMIGELGSQVRVQQTAMRPEVAVHVRQVPPSDRFKLGLAVHQRINGFDPFGLRCLTPRPVPTGGSRIRSHAFRVRPIDGCCSNLGNVHWLVERCEPIEHAFDFQQINLRVVELQSKHFKFDACGKTVGDVSIRRPSSRAICIRFACVLCPQTAIVNLCLTVGEPARAARHTARVSSII